MDSGMISAMSNWFLKYQDTILTGVISSIVAAFLIGSITYVIRRLRGPDQLVVLIKLMKEKLEAADSENRDLLEDTVGALEGERREIRDRSHLKEAQIAIYPEEEYLALCVQKENPRPYINIMTRLTNSGQRVGIVDGMEAVLTGPEGTNFRFVWNLFYEYQRGGILHTMSSYVHPLAIPPEDSIILGIQFVGPDLGISDLYSWPTGRYQVDMTGWVKVSPDRQPTSVNSKFYIHLSPGDIAQLKIWIGWDDEAWRQLCDPDNAAGWPVRVIPA